MIVAQISTPSPWARRLRGPMVGAAFAIPFALGCSEGEVTKQDVATEKRLQTVLDDSVSQQDTLLPGSILYYHDAQYRRWSGAAGVADREGQVPMRPDCKFRAGSITKPLLATAVLQHVEEGSLGLEQTLPELLPESVTARIANADSISLRMLLSHTSGIPDWVTPQTDRRVVMDPSYVWTTDEALELAAESPPLFDPGTSFSYSNTNYTLVGLVLDQVGPGGWREQLRDRILEPVGMVHSSLPEPGDLAIEAPFARGYQEAGEEVFDLTVVDPSMAGAAGGHALVTTAEDLGRFLEALLAGELFAGDETLMQMTTLNEAPHESGLPYAYGLGIEGYALPDGTRVIGHGGGAPGYASMMFQIAGHGPTIVAHANVGNLFTTALQVLMPAVQAVNERGE